MPVIYDQTIKSPSLRPASPAASLRSPGALSPVGSAVPAEASASVAGRDTTLPAPAPAVHVQGDDIALARETLEALLLR